MIKINNNEREILERYFNICESNDYIELEMWTNKGVDMIIYIEQDKFDSVLVGIEQYINNFNIDEEIDIHRLDENYKNNFTIKESLEDFELYIETLKNICKELERLEV